MKKIIFILLILLGLILLSTKSAVALSIFTPSQGGTGIGSATSGDIGNCLKVSNNSPFTYTLGTCGSGGGSSFGQTFELFTNIFSQSALTSTTTQNIHISGTGTSTFVGGLEAWRMFATPYILATSTTDLNKFLNDLVVGTENGSPYLNRNPDETAPAFSFNGDQDTGIYRSGGNTLDFSTGGTRRAYIDSSGVLNLINGFVSQASSTVVGLTNLRYSSTTGQSTFNHASTTTFTLGGITGSAWSDFCTSITGGAGLCDGSDDGGAGTSAFEIATTSDIGLSQLSYFTKTTGRTTLGGVATTTLVAGSGLSFGGATPVILGTSPITISATGGSGSGNVSTSTNETSGTLAYWTSNSATPALLGKVSTTTLTLSGFPASLSGTLGKLVDGTDTTWTWWGLATTSQPSSSNLLVSNGEQGVYGVATSTLTTSSPLTGSFTQIGSGGSLGCQTASGSQAGCLSSTDWTTFNNKQSTISTAFPLQISGGTLSWIGLATSSNLTNGRVHYSTGVNTFADVATSSIANGTGITVTNGSSAFVIGSQPTINCNTASASVFGCLSASDFSKFNSATTTFGSGYATTTLGTLTFSTSTLSFNGLTIGQTIVPSAGALTFTPTITGTLNNAGLTNSTISGISLGSSLNSLTNDATLNGSSYNGSSVISDWGLNLGNANTWTVNQTFNYSSSTIYSSFAIASTTNLIVNGESFNDLTGADLSISSGALTVDTLPNLTGTLDINSGGTNSTSFTTGSLMYFDGTSIVSTSTNPLYVSLLTSTSTATSTFAGRLHIGTTTPTSGGSATFSVKSLMNVVAQFFTSTGNKILEILDTGVVNVLGAWDFGGATSLEIPNGASPTVDATGEIAVDTTSDQYIYYGASAKRVMTPFRYFVLSYATSTAWNGTTTIDLAPSYIAETWSGVKCFTNTGTVNVSINDGTNRMNMFNASTTVGTVALTTNNQFTAGEKRYIDIGTPASSPQKISCTAEFTIDAD